MESTRSALARPRKIPSKASLHVDGSPARDSRGGPTPGDRGRGAPAESQPSRPQPLRRPPQHADDAEAHAAATATWVPWSESRSRRVIMHPGQSEGDQRNEVAPEEDVLA